MLDRIPAEAFPPGEFIKEYLAERNWTQADLAEVLGRNVSVVNEIISGKTGITPETAKGLADALNTTPALWLNLDSAYRLWLTREPKNPAVALRARIYAKAPVRDIVKRGWLEASENPVVLERRVLEFFGINNLEDDLPDLAHAARKSDPCVTNSAQLAWLQRARTLAPAAPVVGAFTSSKMPSVIRAMRELATHPQDVRRVPHVLANAGIRLLIVEPLPRGPIDAACFWLDERAPVIVLSVRYDRIDWFWHTIMHELVHIARGDGHKRMCVEIDLVGADSKKRESSTLEDKVNREAANILIPTEKLEDFIMRSSPTYPAAKVIGFANIHQIHPGIVVGQLQFRGELGYSQMRKSLLPIRSLITSSALTDGWGTILRELTLR